MHAVGINGYNYAFILSYERGGGNSNSVMAREVRNAIS
jgi:hypothetical protein